MAFYHGAMSNESTLLHIEASPRKARSHSLAVARAYIAAYRRAHPSAAIESFDLWGTTLPAIDEVTIAAKFAVMSGAAFTAEQAAAWNRIRTFANQFIRAERLLFSVPMWNRSIPYVLKHYIDLITQPGVLFQRAHDDYRPLGPDRPTTIIYASGNDFVAGSKLHSFDFQKSYFDHWLNFVGIAQIEHIVVAPTVGAASDVREIEREAIARAEQLGARL